MAHILGCTYTQHVNFVRPRWPFEDNGRCVFNRLVLPPWHLVTRGGRVAGQSVNTIAQAGNDYSGRCLAELLTVRDFEASLVLKKKNTSTTFCYVHTSTLDWETPRSHRGHPRILFYITTRHRVTTPQNVPNKKKKTPTPACIPVLGGGEEGRRR